MAHLRLVNEDEATGLQVIAYFNYINRIADAVGMDDEPEWPTEDPGPSPV